MDDAAISALEADIAGLGPLLVQLDKFRARRDPDARTLRERALAIADRTRRAHRHGTLDDALAAALAAEVGVVRRGLTARLAGVRASAAYRDAVQALADGRRTILAVELPAIFDDLEVAAGPSSLYRAVAWQRRGRPRPADEIARDLAAMRADGLAGDDDPETPGVDPELPGLVLTSAPPSGDPLHLVLDAAGLPPPLLVLRPSGDVVVPGARILAPFQVALTHPDDDGDAWVLDPEAFHRALRAALQAHGVPTAS